MNDDIVLRLECTSFFSNPTTTKWGQNCLTKMLISFHMMCLCFNWISILILYFYTAYKYLILNNSGNLSITWLDVYSLIMNYSVITTNSATYGKIHLTRRWQHLAVHFVTVVAPVFCTVLALALRSSRYPLFSHQLFHFITTRTKSMRVKNVHLQ